MYSLFMIDDRIVEVRAKSSKPFEFWINLRHHLESQLEHIEEILNTEDSLVIVFTSSLLLDLNKLEEILVNDSSVSSNLSSCKNQIEIPVKYSANETDLEVISNALNISCSELITLHSGTDYQISMYGFVPGFAYLKGLDPELYLSRKPSPSLHIRAGSVAIAENYTGIYPYDSQGGWHVLGFTDFRFMELENLPAPGDMIKFIPL
jgi:inhibitor of KinA